MDIVRQSLAITLVLALLWAALWLLRRKGALGIASRKAGDPGSIESHGRLALSQQHSIHVVRVRDRELVLALHPSGVTLLCELLARRGGEP